MEPLRDKKAELLSNQPILVDTMLDSVALVTTLSNFTEKIRYALLTK